MNINSVLFPSIDDNIVIYVLLGITSLLLILLILISSLLVKKNKKIKNENNELEKELKEAKEEVKLANKTKDNLISNVTYDLKTPVNNIIGLTNILINEQKVSQSTIKTLKNINNSSLHLSSLIDKMLEISRIKNDRVETKIEGIDIREVLSEVISTLKHEVKEKRIDFLVNTKDIKHPFVFGDRSHLIEIFRNLLSNAIKYTKEEGKVAFIFKEISNTEKTCFFKADIVDTGVGIKKELLNHIFEPFRKDIDDISAKESGTGVGLSITKKYIDMQNGSISIESKVNVGTKVVVMLPFEIDFDENVSLSLIYKNKGVDLEGTKALIVEDNDVSREIEKDLLETNGISVVTAMNGEEAIQKFKESDDGYFDFILMDIEMPSLDGFNSTNLIRDLQRRDSKSIIIIGMSSGQSDKEIRKINKSKMNSYIKKPLSFDSLIRVLGELYTK